VESEKLKPCPFCGSENLRIHNGREVKYGYCTDCGAMAGWGGSEKAAVEKWNTRRTPDPVKVALAEALEALLYKHAGNEKPQVGCGCSACDGWRALASYLEEQAP